MMKLKNSTVSGILLACIVISVVVFYLLYESSQFEVEELPVIEEGLEDWSIENSVLNGAPLNEYRAIYNEDKIGEITKVFITVFPTEDKAGELLDFSSFDLHTHRDKSYNPVLKANIQFSAEEDELRPGINLDTINATIRVRGNSSRGAKYKSYKVKLLDGAETFEGQTTLNLNKHYFDVSKISNKLSFDLMSQVDNMTSFRTNFMLVYIRDASLPKEEQSFQYYGLYTHIEQPNKSYLRVRGLNDNGSLYKANNFEFRLTEELKNVEDPGYDEAAFETVLSIREGNNHNKMLDMLKNINDLNRDFNKDFATYFNEENYLTWMACNILLGNEDTIAHNFLLYNPNNSLTWYMLPWDYDGILKFGNHETNYLVPETLEGIQRYTGVMLHRRYFVQNNKIDKLTAKMEELLSSSFSEKRINSLLSSYLPVLEKTMTISPDLNIIEMSPNELVDYLGHFNEQINLHYEEYLNAIKYPTPVFVSEPEVLEKGSVHFKWENSFDFQGDLLTYGITVARDYNMQDIIFQEDGLVTTSFDYEQGLPPGTYYLAITITDSLGNRQISLDYYNNYIDAIYKFGVREFIVD